jgi:hypothetical protein
MHNNRCGIDFIGNHIEVLHNATGETRGAPVNNSNKNIISFWDTIAAPNTVYNFMDSISYDFSSLKYHV